MSKENVALFVRMTAEKRDLNNKAGAQPSSEGWIQLGKDVGLQFDENDLVGFVTEMVGKKVDPNNAVPAFLTAMSSGELDHAALDQVSGGVGGIAPIAYSATLSKTLVANGYVPPGGTGGSTYQFPPDTSKAGGGGQQMGG